MKNLNASAKLDMNDDLRRVVEPLANYICATGRPRRSLRLALAALSIQIEQTNRLAASQAAAFVAGQLAATA